MNANNRKNEKNEKMYKNNMVMENTTNGAQVGGKAANVRRIENVNENEKREALNAAARAKWDINGLFGVGFSTIRKRIMAAERGERPCGVVAHGQYKCLGGHINLYIKVTETFADGWTNYTTTIEAYRYEWNSFGVETVEQTVNFQYMRNYEESFREVLGAVLVKYVAAYYGKCEENVANEHGMTVEEWRVECRRNEEQERVDELKAALDESLAEAGWNALNLAYALAEAMQHTDGAVTPDNVAEQALWRSYRGQIERRLESLGDGTETPAPGLENAAEKLSETNGNPAPGLLEQVEDMLAADWEKMDETEDGYDIDYHRVDGYWLQTTANSNFDHGWMHVSLRLTDELAKKYVTDAHEAWELTWRVEFDDDVNDVAEKVCRAMETAPRTFFRVGAVYIGDDGKCYQLASVEWDGYRGHYNVTLIGAHGEEMEAVMDAAATVVNFRDGDENVVFHAEDIAEL